MDELDWAILKSIERAPRRLAWYPGQPAVRNSLANIGKDLNVDENTVRRRLKRMRLSGYLRAIGVTPSPGAVGLREGIARFEVRPPATKAATIKKVVRVKGVYRIRSYFGRALQVELCYKNEHDFEKKIERIAKVANAEEVVLGRIPFKRVDFRFRKSDVAILECLIGSASKPYTTVARETGLSSRTARRRLRVMQESGALNLIVNTNPRALRGSLIGELLVFCGRPVDLWKTVEEVKGVLGDRAHYQAVSTEHAFWRLRLSNISERDEILNRVKSMEGVKSVSLELMEDSLVVVSAFRDNIKRAARQGGFAPTSSTYRRSSTSIT